jgi:hypothetical protein
MDNPQTLNSLFREGVSAIDAGETSTLQKLLSTNPGLASVRLQSPGPWLRDKAGDYLDGFFQKPYLLWFVAEDCPQQ